MAHLGWLGEEEVDAALDAGGLDLTVVRPLALDP